MQIDSNNHRLYISAVQHRSNVLESVRVIKLRTIKPINTKKYPHIYPHAKFQSGLNDITSSDLSLLGKSVLKYFRFSCLSVRLLREDSAIGYLLVYCSVIFFSSFFKTTGEGPRTTATKTLRVVAKCKPLAENFVKIFANWISQQPGEVNQYTELFKRTSYFRLVCWVNYIEVLCCQLKYRARKICKMQN